MGRGNTLFIILTFASMAAGVLAPGVGEPLRHLATAGLMTQLLLSFLATAGPDASITREHFQGLPRLMLVRMVLVPLLCCLLCIWLLPQYALGAVLLAGTAVGVVAPFFAAQVRADILFTVAAVIVSSLLLPLTMPLLTLVYFLLSGQEAAGGLWMSFLRTGVALACYIFIPFVVARCLWRFKPAAARGVLSRRYPVSLVCVTVSMFIIFSQFALPLRENPAAVLDSLLASLVLAALFIVVGAVAGMRQHVEKRLSYVICMSTGNNVLMVILASQFFGLPEVLLTAMYSVPLFLLLAPYGWYSAWMRRRG